MKEKIRSQLARLRGEIEALPKAQEGARIHLGEIAAEIEASLENESQQRESGLTDRIRKTVEDFEIEHPRATAILNDISAKLASMGI